MDSITITQPDDWHVHLRDGAALAAVVPDTARQFGRAIVMPNLKPPITSVDMASAYRDRILSALPQGSAFEPLMTLYLTDMTSADDVRAARESGIIHGIKLYPAGATTHSSAGVTDIARRYRVFEAMALADIPLLLHGEVVDPAVDVFDRERVFLERYLAPITTTFPSLRIVLEHVTTQEGVEFVLDSGPNVAATLTAHHLLLNRNAMFAGGIRPHNYCLPVLKREQHREALVAAATSGNPKFFLGTDSAPHPKNSKESDCGCAGIYTAHAALELYAEVFDQAGALDRLEAFASFHGADFYRLPRNQTHIRLTRQTWTTPESLPMAEQTLIPFRAGEMINWRFGT